MKKAIKSIVVLALFAITVSLLSCAYLSHKGAAAFAAVNMGDSQAKVIASFGMPYVVKPVGVAFPRYAAQGCRPPCAERMWFRNVLSMDIEAWSVDLDKQGRVIGKSHWSSP